MRQHIVKPDLCPACNCLITWEEEGCVNHSCIIWKEKEEYRLEQEEAAKPWFIKAGDKFDETEKRLKEFKKEWESVGGLLEFVAGATIVGSFLICACGLVALAMFYPLFGLPSIAGVFVGGAYMNDVAKQKRWKNELE